MDRYAFLYSSFFILFHWQQGGKIIWMMLVAKKEKTATFITEIPHLHSFTDCILYKYQQIAENLRTLDEIRKLRYSIEKILKEDD